LRGAPLKVDCAGPGKRGDRDPRLGVYFSTLAQLSVVVS
jgi:hypothetical protein